MRPAFASGINSATGRSPVAEFALLPLVVNETGVD